MHYIKIKSVKEKFHKAGKQITKDGLMALDITVEQIIEKAIRQFNGHHRRIDATLINLGSKMSELLRGKRKGVNSDVSKSRAGKTGRGSTEVGDDGGRTD